MHTRFHIVLFLPALLSLILAGCGGAAGMAPAMAPTGAPMVQDQARQAIPEGEANVPPPPPATAAPAATSAPAVSAPAEAPAAAVDEAAATGLEPLPEATAVPEPVAENPFTPTTEDALSTFALDVDTASYSTARNYLTNGQLPPPNMARVEEFVNYFDYDYPTPEQGAFGISIDSAPSPFGAEGTQIVRVGIQGKQIESAERSDASLTFVIDVSGSMQDPNRLPLVKQALHLLVDQLRESDQVGIVVYGSEARVVLEHTSAANRDAIKRAIDSLGNEGSTNAEAGLKLAYELAAKNFKTGGINRVILCSDGVANVGATGPDAILTSIRDYAAQGVYLTTVGFGMGSYNDQMMEQLANDGNGNYAYVDTIDEAKRVFVENLTGTLQVIAKDAKVQVDFNPAVVSQYRLLGYENRAVADTDFRNDKVDAGEIGAGHSVTALYEVVLTGQGAGTALTVQMRYADPQSGVVSEISQPFTSEQFGAEFSAASPRLQLAVAVAAFAENMRNSSHAEERPLADVLAIAERIAPQLANDADVQEFVELVRKAQALS